MRKPKLLIFLIVSGLIAGRFAGHFNNADSIGLNSLAGLGIGTGILLWMILAYHME